MRRQPGAQVELRFDLLAGDRERLKVYLSVATAPGRHSVLLYSTLTRQGG
jgi:hypothetical protein